MVMDWIALAVHFNFDWVRHGGPLRSEPKVSAQETEPVKSENGRRRTKGHKFKLRFARVRGSRWRGSRGGHRPFRHDGRHVVRKFFVSHRAGRSFGAKIIQLLRLERTAWVFHHKRAALGKWHRRRRRRNPGM